MSSVDLSSCIILPLSRSPVQLCNEEQALGVCHHLHHVTGIVAPVTDSVYPLMPSVWQSQVYLAH